MGCFNGPNYYHQLSSKKSHELSRARNRNRYGRFMDQAWTIVLYKKGFIPRESAVKVLAALGKTETGGEDVLKKILKDGALASIPVIVRTLQEPMSRMQLRDKQLDVIEASQQCLEDILNRAEDEAETIMPGATHMAHTQPTTYGAYLVAIHDGLYRSLEQIELAYKHTNENSGGCGACSGTGWDVDRNMITELLGFDRLQQRGVCHTMKIGKRALAQPTHREMPLGLPRLTEVFDQPQTAQGRIKERQQVGDDHVIQEHLAIAVRRPSRKARTYLSSSVRWVFGRGSKV